MNPKGDGYTTYSFTEIHNDKGHLQSISKRACCCDNVPIESFFGRMEDHIKNKIDVYTEFNEVKAIIDDYMDYYNNDCYQWNLAKLSPNEFYQFYMTGEYPIKTSNPPKVHIPEKSPVVLRHKIDETKTELRQSTLGAPNSNSA